MPAPPPWVSHSRALVQEPRRAGAVSCALHRFLRAPWGGLKTSDALNASLRLPLPRDSGAAAATARQSAAPPS